ncbi:MAG: HNH endonuclease [bacterium]
MQFFVGVTDNAWYRHLADLKPDEVNFWRPGGGSFEAIPLGAPFLFKLHRPLNVIAGGGFFVRADRLPLSLAWDTFGQKNGAPSLAELRRLIQARRRDAAFDPEIGCIVLNEPFFLQEDRWIPAPEDWSKNIVVGKTYETADAVGQRIWEEVCRRLDLPSIPSSGYSELPGTVDPNARYGSEYLARARLGQGMFRLLVEDAYQKRCSMTGEKTRPVLQAAHIRPFTESGPNRVDNGLLLRSDLHILFDRGYITVTRDHRIEVSQRIRDEFDNGREYYPLHGRRLLILPANMADQPRTEFIDWHNEKVFLG